MSTHGLPQAYHCLLNAELSHWILPLMQFLRRYEGIERALEPEQLPLNYLSESLKNIDTSNPKEKEPLFFNAVASLPLLYYRVSGQGTCWHPGNETLLQFEQRVGTISIWQDWAPQLSKQYIVKWMRTKLSETQHVRHPA